MPAMGFGSVLMPAPKHPYPIKYSHDVLQYPSYLLQLHSIHLRIHLLQLFLMSYINSQRDSIFVECIRTELYPLTLQQYMSGLDYTPQALPTGIIPLGYASVRWV